MTKKETKKQKAVMLRLENDNWIDLKIMCLKKGQSLKDFVSDCVDKELQKLKKIAA